MIRAGLTVHRPAILLLTGLALACSGAPDPSPPPRGGPAAEQTQAAPLPASARQELDAVQDLVSRARSENSAAVLDEAEQRLETLRGAGPESAELLRALATVGLVRAELPPGRVPDDAVGDLLERAFALDPDDPGTLQLLIDYHALAKQPEASVALTEGWLQRHPDDSMMTLAHGELLLRLGREAEAEAAMRRAIALEEVSPHDDVLFRAHTALSVMLMGQGRSDEAEGILRDSIRSMDTLRRDRPDGAIIACPYEALGRFYRQQGQTAEAAVAYHRGAEADPRQLINMQAAAETLLEVGRPDRASLHAERLLIRYGEEHRALLQRCRQASEERAQGLEDAGEVQALLELGFEALRGEQYPLSQGYVERVERRGGHPRATLLAGLLATMEGRFEDATALLAEAERAAESRAGALVGQGHLAVVEKRHDLAQGRFEQGLALLDGDDAYTAASRELARLGEAWVLAYRGQHNEAAAAFTALLEDNPDLVRALQGLANALMAKGELDRASRIYQRALLFDPNNAEVLAGLGLLHYNQRDDAQAEHYFLQAKRLAPERYTCPYEGLGLVYLRQGKVEQAKQHLERAIAIDPDIEHLKYTELARIYIEEGRRDEARGLLLRSLENEPDQPNAQELLESLDPAP
jgi:tetratricopeptide (TPR) repeat protein